MTVIKFEDVSKRYKLYSKGGLYMRDRLSHALQRFNPFNGHHGAQNGESNQLSPTGSHALKLGTEHALEKDFWALKNISFEIKQGESVGFIGRNGAGKSTILKLLAGVTKASSGTVEINGRVAAMIEVGAGFHPELTGRENIYLNGSIMGMTKDQIEKDFDSIVDYAELENFIDTPVKHYSSGMYVRLGFAIAVHTTPDIFLIDEVLAVGDEAFQKKCVKTLEEHRAAGKTMILVSHQLEKIEEICERCIYIDHGAVRFDGAPKDAITEYRLGIAGITSKEDKNSVGKLISGVGDGDAASAHNDVQTSRPKSISADKNRGDGYFLHIRDHRREISVSCGERLVLEFEIEAPAPIAEATVGVTITDLRGIPIMSMSSKVQNVPRDPTLSKFWKTVCDMGEVPLNAGTYFMQIYVGNGQSDYARFSDVFGLKVLARDVFGWGNHLPSAQSWGAVFWAPKWDIQAFCDSELKQRK
jgi:ABC-type polysaccharide/polyol phosphate transport system ATPase subunit